MTIYTAHITYDGVLVALFAAPVLGLLLAPLCEFRSTEEQIPRQGMCKRFPGEPPLGRMRRRRRRLGGQVCEERKSGHEKS